MSRFVRVAYMARLGSRWLLSGNNEEEIGARGTHPLESRLLSERRNDRLCQLAWCTSLAQVT